MEKSILLKLYDGELNADNRYLLQTKELMHLHEKHSITEKRFSEKLKNIDPSLACELQTVLENQYEELSCESGEIFVDGFKMGARIMIEIFAGDYSHGEKA